MLLPYTLFRFYLPTYVTREVHGFTLPKLRYIWRIYHRVCYVYSVKGLLNFTESLLPLV
jgi:hypothetical protein